MTNIKDQVLELKENQKHMLEAIRYLTEKVKDMENKEHDVENIVESQAFIDEIIVKNSDDIIAMKRLKHENAESIKKLDTKIDDIDKEVERRTLKIKEELECKTICKEDIDNIAKAIKERDNDKICNHFNRGYCRLKERCPYKHKSKEICTEHLRRTLCLNQKCNKRHPKMCRDFLRGICWRRDSCAYLHCYEPKIGTIDKIVITEDIEYFDTENDIQNIESKFECGKCKSEQAKNKCDKCQKHYCSECEYKLNGESVIEFWKSKNFTNYTCLTAHY